MNSLLFYIIASGVSLGLFITAYQLLLKNNTRFNLCRFYLISAILFSFIIPFITIDIGISFVEKKEIIGYKSNLVPAQNFEVQELPAEPIQIEKNTLEIDYTRIAGIVFLSISLLLFVRFIFRFGSIILIQTSGNRYENEDGTNLIFTDKTDNAFSFLGSIFINPLKFTDEEKRLIIEHEREHIRHLHSIDLIIIELLIVMQWFNPFAYITRRKLIEIHEFIADNGVIRKGADPYSYQNLLLSVVSSSCLPTVGNQLSALITKKRIAMIGKPLNQTGRWINFLILVPITLTLIIGISAFSPAKPKRENQDEKKTELKEIAKKQGITDAIEELYFDLKSNEYQEQQTVELIGGNDYTFHFIPRTKEEGIHAYINSNIKDVAQGGVIIFSGSRKLMVHVKKNSKFTLRIGNRSSINKVDLLALICNNGKHNPANEITPSDNQTSLNFNSQDLNKKNEVADTFLVVEQMPTFGNGNEYEFPKWISINMKYPKEAIEKGLQGNVFVEFLVSKDGSIKNPRIRKGVDPLLDAEALRLINSCPKWNPGKQRGIAVDVLLVKPVPFSAIVIEKPIQTTTTDIQETEDQAFKELKNRANEDVKGTQLADFYINVEPRKFNMYTITLKQNCEYNFKLYSNNNDDKFIATISRGNLQSGPNKLFEKRVSNNEDFNFITKVTGYYVLTLENISSKKTPALMVLTYKGEQKDILEWGKSDFPGIYEGLEKADKTYYQEKKDKQPVSDDEVFVVVEKMPVFGTGTEGEFNDWLKSNIQYPKEAAEKGIQGRVFVQFVIEKDGSVTNAKVIRGVDPLLDKEALRVVLSSPNWKPGMQNGKNVRVYWTNPVTFNSTIENKTSQINELQEVNKQTSKTLEKRAEDEAKGTYLKDFKIQLASGENERYSIILKKGVTYNFYLFSNSKEDKFNTSLDRSLPDKTTVNEKTIDFSYSSNFTFTPEFTAAYILSTKNLSSKNASSIIYLTLK